MTMNYPTTFEIKRLLKPLGKFKVRKETQTRNTTTSYNIIYNSNLVDRHELTGKVDAILMPLRTCTLTEDELTYNSLSDGFYSNYNSYNFHWTLVPE